MSIGPKRNIKKKMKKIKSNLITKTISDRLYQLPVPIIGLTGGIATGKSTVAKILSEQKIPIIDADRLVKKVYQKIEIKNFIAQHFPEAIISNEIDFKTLRRVAFSSKENIEKIETQIYKYLPEEFLLEYQSFQNPSYVIYDVPLLFEKGLDKLVDQKVCVYANRDLQISRLMKRDSITKEDAANILSHQINIDEKKNRSDIVINNETNEQSLRQNVEDFISKILE